MVDRDLFDAPIETPAEYVRKEWIDVNGHMNMAYYSLLFDRAIDTVLDRLGVGAEYTQSGAGTVFVLQSHVSFLKEARVDTRVRIAVQLIDWDSKRIHYVAQMFAAGQNNLLATSEQIALHVGLPERRARPFPDAVQSSIEKMHRAHARLPLPTHVGRPIAIRRT